MEAFKTIREKLNWTCYRMAKELGVSQTQYNYLERTAKTAQTHVLIKLKNLSGLSAEQFWKILEKEHD